MFKSTLPTFHKLVEEQFTYGGQKYKNNGQKEATDLLFEHHSFRWLVGTIDKYTYRYGNLARERDLLKIATYMYIMWLKRGFHVSTTGTDEVIDTTVPIKTANFEMFQSWVEMDKNLDHVVTDPVECIHQQCYIWSLGTFNGISPDSITSTYIAAYSEWHEKFSKKAGQDTDTGKPIPPA